MQQKNSDQVLGKFRFESWCWGVVGGLVRTVKAQLYSLRSLQSIHQTKSTTHIWTLSEKAFGFVKKKRAKISTPIVPRWYNETLFTIALVHFEGMCIRPGWGCEVWQIWPNSSGPAAPICQCRAWVRTDNRPEWSVPSFGINMTRTAVGTEENLNGSELR